MKKNKLPELLAPAGSIESIYAAVRCGADAVYAGGERFSARANAVNFTDDELKEAITYCHLHGVKFYQAMNTLVFDEEVRDFLLYAEKSALLGVDALIVQDLGMASLIKQNIPELKLNASTQMTIHTENGALFAKELGFSRVVLSRELSLEQIERIAKIDIETEVFVHGALCMSVSGQCYMSAAIGSRSANRGLCAQACRLPFSAVFNEDRYDLSLKDLSAVQHLDRLAEIGVNSFKIEGRMKRAEYVAAAVLCCRAKLDGLEPDMDTLRAVFSRSGFTDGYITGNLGKDMFGTRQKEDVVSAEDVLPALRENYRKETKSLTADFHVSIKRDMPVSLTMTCGDISVETQGDVPQIAQNRPTDIDTITKQLSKLGDTVYEIRNISADIGDDNDVDKMLIIPASQLNALRRDAVTMMDKKVLEINTPSYEISTIGTSAERRNNNIDKKLIRIGLLDISQLNESILGNADIDSIVMPISECEKIASHDKIIISLPRFVVNESALISRLEKLKEQGFKHILCTNISHIKLGRDMGFSMHGGYGLNVTNTFSVKALEGMGLQDITVSFECKTSQISHLGGSVKISAIAHGFLPLMLTRNCPIKSAVSCSNCTGKLIDRTGRSFSVMCNAEREYAEIFNSDLLVMSDRVNELHTDLIELDLFNETPIQIENIVQSYKNSRKLDVNSYTRGLYYRGIK